MRGFLTTAAALPILMSICASAQTGKTLPPPAAVKINYDQHVKPILAAKCFSCHGAKQVMSGLRLDLRPVAMDFRYGTSFGMAAPEAYERLLLDAMRGDPTLFARSDWVEAAWEALAPIQAAWAAGLPKLPTYEAGSAGPREADELLAREGRRWRRL